MRYQEVVNYLMDIPGIAGKTTKENIEQLLEALGNPLEQQTIIHVAGTNGKGSTCAFLNSLLEAQGYRTGMFTSPHLIDIRERIRIHGELIDEAMFCQAFLLVKDAIDRVVGQGGLHPSFFETLFLMATVIFKEKQLDYCIYEAGLGGSRDVTNVLEPILSIITTISLEHTEYLGETLEEIAREKAGIIKPHVPVISLDKNIAITSVLQQIAEEKQSPYVMIKEKDYLDFSTNVLYQRENASLAGKAMEVLDIPVSVTALEKTYWPGRMEEILPEIYVDGAHNMEAIETLVRTLDTCHKYKNKVLLFSVAEDKKYEEMIAYLCGHAEFQEVILTTMDNTRGCDARVMAECFHRYGQQNVVIMKEPLEAFQYGREAIGDNTMLICTGSLYFIGQLKRLLGGNND